MKKEHIFAGVWLEDLTFSDAVQDDASLVSKRLADGVNELAVVECTALVAGKSVSFDGAGELARKALTQEDLECVIDVRRARLSGVRPLPLRVKTKDGWTVERENRAEEELTAAPKQRASLPDSAAETPAGRKNRWERKLLDLGLRNALINLRPAKTLVPLLTASVDDLEDALSDGADFSVLPRPADWKTDAPDLFTAMAAGMDAAELLSSEFKNHCLRSLLTESELGKSIKELYRAAKVSLEESGANTVYLALGLLRWYETQKSTVPRYAPLVLIPIDMARKSAAEGYVIRLRDDEPQMNITLLEKLQMDYGLSVPGLDSLPRDEHGWTPGRYSRRCVAPSWSKGTGMCWKPPVSARFPSLNSSCGTTSAAVRRTWRKTRSSAASWTGNCPGRRSPWRLARRWTRTMCSCR